MTAMEGTFLFLWLVSFSILAFREVPRRDKEILSLQKDLAAKEEQLRFLRKLNPEPNPSLGWAFFYDKDENQVKKRRKIEGTTETSTVCHITTFFDDDQYGYRIAKLLNDGYITASPEPERNMEVVFKEPWNTEQDAMGDFKRGTEALLNQKIPSQMYKNIMEELRSKVDDLDKGDKVLKTENWSFNDHLESKGVFDAKQECSRDDEFISKVPTIKVDIPMPPVKPPKK